MFKVIEKIPKIGKYIKILVRLLNWLDQFFDNMPDFSDLTEKEKEQKKKVE